MPWGISQTAGVILPGHHTASGLPGNEWLENPEDEWRCQWGNHLPSGYLM